MDDNSKEKVSFEKIIEMYNALDPDLRWILVKQLIDISTDEILAESIRIAQPRYAQDVTVDDLRRISVWLEENKPSIPNQL